jgi:hypothetical protein
VVPTCCYHVPDGNWEHRKLTDGSSNHKDSPQRDTKIEPSVGRVSVTEFNPTVGLAASFASEWYADSLNAADVSGTTMRRHEIVFAVCTVESYLFEWVRDTVLAKDYDLLTEYFPQGEKRGIRKRWKCTLKALYRDRRISCLPPFNTEAWSDFTSLLDLRDGLVHAGASRPDISQSAKQKPIPAVGALNDIQPGWACLVVEALIRELHSALGTTPPPWLREP